MIIWIDTGIEIEGDPDSKEFREEVRRRFIEILASDEFCISSEEY